MFGGEHPLLEGGRSIIRPDCHSDLPEHLAGIEILCHHVNGAAANLVTCFDRPCMSIKTAIFGQQGRVDVEDPPAPFLDKQGRKNAHEAGESDRADTVVVECRAHSSIKVFLADPPALESPGLKA